MRESRRKKNHLTIAKRIQFAPAFEKNAASFILIGLEGTQLMGGLLMPRRRALLHPTFLSTIGPLRSSGRSATECRLRPELSNLPHAAKMGCPADQETEIRSGPG